MYFPYINTRYTDEAVVWSYEDMKKEFAKCIHLLVLRDNDEIAGTLINIRGRKSRACGLSGSKMATSNW